jgi:hypothetical protein
MKVGEGNTEQAISRRGFLGASAAGGASAVLSSFVPGRDAGAEELARIDLASASRKREVISPTRNLTFHDFKPVTEKELTKEVTDVDQMVNLAYKHGMIAKEVGTYGSNARSQFSAALKSTGSNRAEKLRPMIIALSNLKEDGILTERQVRDFFMRHLHTASFIAISLDKNSSGQRRIPAEQAEDYYRILMQIEGVQQGYRAYEDILKQLGLTHEEVTVARADITQ